jgi:hypothetical protein
LRVSLYTRLSTALADEMAAIELYLARNLWAWFRADTYTGSTNVASLVDRVLLTSEGAIFANARSVNPAHALVHAAARPSLPTADAALNGRPSSTFAGAQYLDSNIAATNWKFMHDGSDFVDVHTFVPTSLASNSILCATYNAAGIGIHRILLSTGNVTADTYQPVLVATCPAGPIAVGAGTTMEVVSGTAQTPDVTSRVSGGTPASVNYTGAVSGSDPGYTFCLGSRGNRDVPLRARWADTMIANRVNDTLLANIRRYRFLRYGQAA